MQDSYARAARAKHTDPGRRADARTIATIVHGSDVGGVRRDWLRNRLRAWPEPRFRQALFYAYGRAWVDFIGWTYVVAIAPAAARLADPGAPQPPCTPSKPPAAAPPAPPPAPPSTQTTLQTTDPETAAPARTTPATAPSTSRRTSPRAAATQPRSYQSA